MSNKKSLQFELWQECNTRCAWCYLRDFNKTTPDRIKIRGINHVMNAISDIEKIKDYDVISFIGGEFFQGQMKNKEVKDAFFNMMKRVAELQVKGYFPEVWLLCTLALGDQKELYETLDMMQKIYKKAKKPEIMDRFWIVTSYDTIGRFHSKKMEDNWKSHMKKLKKKYPRLKLNTCMILTGDLVRKYNRNEFSFEKFEKEFNTQIFLKQVNPVIRNELTETFDKDLRKNWMEVKRRAENILPGLLFKRSEFLEFLTKLRNESKHLFDKSLNIEYRADDLYRNAPVEEDDKSIEYVPRYKDKKIDQYQDAVDFVNDCGHLSKYAAYLDSNRCMLCDKLNLD